MQYMPRRQLCFIKFNWKFTHVSSCLIVKDIAQTDFRRNEAIKKTSRANINTVAQRQKTKYFWDSSTICLEPVHKIFINTRVTTKLSECLWRNITGHKRVGLWTEEPTGSRGRDLVGSGSNLPEAGDTCYDFLSMTGNMFHPPLLRLWILNIIGLLFT